MVFMRNVAGNPLKFSLPVIQSAGDVHPRSATTSAAARPIRRIALVRPAAVLPERTYTTVVGAPSLALAYLAAVVKKSGRDVIAIDAFGSAPDAFTPVGKAGLYVNGLDIDDIVARIPEDVGLIGVSCMFSNEWPYHKQVINAIARRFPNTPIILGGEHVSADPDYCFDCCPGVLACAIGEGEDTLVELIAAVEAGRPLSTVDGLAIRTDDGRVIRTGKRARRRQLSELPWPDWSGMPIENYLSRGIGHGVARVRNLPLLASRGCPFQCAFCSSPQMWGTRWDIRDVDDVVAEMKSLVANYGVNSFSFYDLTAIIRKDWILAFANRLIEEKLNITWNLPSGTRSESLDAEVVRALYASGCRSLTYAPESGSQRTLERIRKRVKLDNMLVSMRASVREGLLQKANIVVGFPGERKRDVLASYAFILRMAAAGVRDVAVFPFVPYPGSAFHDELCAAGRIPARGEAYERFLENNVYNSFAGMRSWSEHFGDAAIRLFTTGGMAIFYSAQFALRPWRIVGTASRILRGKPDTMLERMLEGVMVRMRGMARSPQKRTQTTATNDEVLPSDRQNRHDESTERAVHDAAA